MRQHSNSSLAFGALLGVFIAWGCSVAGDMQDAGAQAVSGVEWERISVPCSDAVTVEEGGASLIILFDPVTEAEDIVAIPSSRRATSAGLLQPSAGAFVKVDGTRIRLGDVFSGLHDCAEWSTYELLIAR